jgi:hypothetical protein
VPKPPKIHKGAKTHPKYIKEPKNKYIKEPKKPKKKKRKQENLNIEEHYKIENNHCHD